MPARHLSAVIHINAISEPAQIVKVADMREMLPQLGDLVEPLVFGLQRYGLVVPWDYGTIKEHRPLQSGRSRLLVVLA